MIEVKQIYVKNSYFIFIFTFSCSLYVKVFIHVLKHQIKVRRASEYFIIYSDFVLDSKHEQESIFYLKSGYRLAF